MRILQKNRTVVKLPLHIKNTSFGRKWTGPLHLHNVISFGKIVLSAFEVMEVNRSFRVHWGCFSLSIFTYIYLHVLVLLDMEKRTKIYPHNSSQFATPFSLNGIIIGINNWINIPPPRKKNKQKIYKKKKIKLNKEKTDNTWNESGGRVLS